MSAVSSVTDSGYVASITAAAENTAASVDTTETEQESSEDSVTISEEALALLKNPVKKEKVQDINSVFEKAYTYTATKEELLYKLSQLKGTSVLEEDDTVTTADVDLLETANTTQEDEEAAYDGTDTDNSDIDDSTDAQHELSENFHHRGKQGS